MITEDDFLNDQISNRVDDSLENITDKPKTDDDAPEVTDDLLDDQPITDDDSPSDGDSPFTKAAEALLEFTGLEVEGEFDDNVEGFYALVEQTVYSTLSPEALELDQILKKGGSIEDWRAFQDETSQYENVDMDDEDTLRELVSRQLIAKGTDEDDIPLIIQNYEDKGKLSEKAKGALNFLKKDAEDKKSAYLEELAESEAKEIKAHKDYVEDLYKQAEKLDKFGNTVIPKKVKDEFMEYMFTPVNSKNQSRMMIDGQKPENIVLSAFAQFKKFSIDDLMASEQVNVSRKILGKAKSNDGGAAASSPTINKKAPLFKI